jgi:hypothetical protein
LPPADNRIRLTSCDTQTPRDSRLAVASKSSCLFIKAASMT